MSILVLGIFIVYALKGSVEGLPLTTRRHFRSLRTYIKISFSQKGKFYCEINYFICEITSRLLRDKLFYLRVEFRLLPRELFSTFSQSLPDTHIKKSIKSGLHYAKKFQGMETNYQRLGIKSVRDEA